MIQFDMDEAGHAYFRKCLKRLPRLWQVRSVPDIADGVSMWSERSPEEAVTRSLTALRAFVSFYILSAF